jgi:hypothetical protein
VDRGDARGPIGIHVDEFDTPWIIPHARGRRVALAPCFWISSRTAIPTRPATAECDAPPARLRDVVQAAVDDGPTSTGRGVAFRGRRAVRCRRLQSFGGYGVPKDATPGVRDIFNPLIVSQPLERATPMGARLRPVVKTPGGYVGQAAVAHAFGLGSR